MKVLAKQASFKRIANTLACIVIATGITVLCGWQFNVAPMKSIFPSMVPMNPMTAVCFLLLGVVLLLKNKRSATPLDYRWGSRLAFLVVLITFFKLSQYMFGTQTGLDRILFTDKLLKNVMAPNTALNLFLTGYGLMIVDRGHKSKYHPVEFVAVAVSATSFFAVVGYLYDVTAFTQTASFYIPMALVTALNFITLSAALLFARPEYGVMNMLCGDGVGSFTLRRLLPLAIIIPLGLSILRLHGQRLGLYGTEFGTALLTVVLIVVFIGLFWYVGGILNEMGKKLSELSIYDDLTGLYNRRGFKTLITQKIKEARRLKRPLVLFLIDLNKMKQINDVHGHNMGDEALVETARLLKKSFRETDIICRWGGDEFIVFGVDTSTEFVQVIKERFFKRLDEYNSTSGQPYKLSMSIGEVVRDFDEHTLLEDLVLEADKQMYQIKQRMEAAENPA